MRIAIVENTEVTHHGLLGVALHEAAAVIDLYKPWHDGVLPAIGSYDALVSFGGEQSARDDAAHPYLPRLADLLAESAGRDLPTLGICLGAQLMARGLGGENLLGRTPEFGWTEITQVAEDPWLGTLPARFPIFQWHSDTFTLPQGARHLARSAGAEVQAFRFGKAGLATRFHFEASRAVVRDWSRRFPALCEKMAPGWAAAQGAEARVGDAADAHGLALARAFIAAI